MNQCNKNQVFWKLIALNFKWWLLRTATRNLKCLPLLFINLIFTLLKTSYKFTCFKNITKLCYVLPISRSYAVWEVIGVQERWDCRFGEYICFENDYHAAWTHIIYVRSLQVRCSVLFAFAFAAHILCISILTVEITHRSPSIYILTGVHVLFVRLIRPFDVHPNPKRCAARRQKEQIIH